MARQIRNLLMMAALCWVAPVSAQQPPAESESHLSGGCPHANQGAEVVVVSEQALGEVPISAGLRAFMP